MQHTLIFVVFFLLLSLSKENEAVVETSEQEVHGEITISCF